MDTLQQTWYDHGFYGTASRIECPEDLLAFYDEGQRDERECANAEYAHEQQMIELYGDAQ